MHENNGRLSYSKILAIQSWITDMLLPDGDIDRTTGYMSSVISTKTEWGDDIVYLTPRLALTQSHIHLFHLLHLLDVRPNR